MMPHLQNDRDEHRDERHVCERCAEPGAAKETFDWIRFTRLENVPFLLRREVDAVTRLALWSRIAKCDADDIASTLEHIDCTTAHAAEMIAQEIDVEPLRSIAVPESRITAVGDSITADRQGWAEVLRLLLIRLEPSLTFTNAGIAGTTSTDTVERLDLIAATKPDTVLLMIGTNDARTQRLFPDFPLVSASESRRNLSILHEALRNLAGRVIVFTPPPLWPAAGLMAMREERADHASKAENLDALAEHIRRLGEDVVDLRAQPVFDPKDMRFMDADGVHPTTRGQAEIVKALIRHLSEHRARMSPSPSPCAEPA